MRTIEVEYETDIQCKTIIALANSFRQGTINFDIFIMWVLKTFDTDKSVFLRVLEDINKERL